MCGCLILILGPQSLRHILTVHITLQTESGRIIRRIVRALRPLLPEQHQQYHDNDSNNRVLQVRIRDTQILVATSPVRAPAQPVHAPGQTVTGAGRIIVEPHKLNL